MTCPICNGKTKVIDSRHEDDSTRRRRECAECGYRFSTIEVDSDLYQRMVKNDRPRSENTLIQPKTRRT